MGIIANLKRNCEKLFIHSCHFPLHFNWSYDSWALRTLSTDINVRIALRIFLSASDMNATFGNRGIFALRSIEIDAYRKCPLKSFEPTRVICIWFHLCLSIFMSVWKYCFHFWKYSWNIRNYSIWIRVYFGDIYNVRKSNNLRRFLSTSIRIYFVRETYDVLECTSPKFELILKYD